MHVGFNCLFGILIHRTGCPNTFACMRDMQLALKSEPFDYLSIKVKVIVSSPPVIRYRTIKQCFEDSTDLMVKSKHDRNLKFSPLFHVYSVWLRKNKQRSCKSFLYYDLRGFYSSFSSKPIM